MAHAVRTSRVDLDEQAKSISDLEAQNPSLKGKVKILRVAWRSKTLKEQKSHGPLLLEVGTPGEANILVQEGLLHEGELKDCELFHGDCNLTECFRCRRYGHIAKRCYGKLACGYCAKEHETRSCPSSNSPQDFSCSNCKGKHTTWSKFCPERQAMVSKAAAAYAARQVLYKVPAKSPPPPPPPPPPATTTSPTPHTETPLAPHQAVLYRPDPVIGKRTQKDTANPSPNSAKKPCSTGSLEAGTSQDSSPPTTQAQQGQPGPSSSSYSTRSCARLSRPSIITAPTIASDSEETL